MPSPSHESPEFVPAKLPRKAAKSRQADAAHRLDLLQLEDRTVPAGQITGQVFLDFNSNGLLDTTSTLPNDGGGTYTRQTDLGVAGVIVTAFDASNTVRGTATTAADGTYILAATGTGGYRLEFTNVPSGNFTGPQGTNPTPPPFGSFTSVQFVPDGNSTNRNLSLGSPTGYSDNPQIITNEYRVGDQTGTLTKGPLFGTDDFSNTGVIISFPYSAGSTSQSNTTEAQQPTTNALSVEARFVGTTWGLAHNTNTSTILAAAFTKKHTGYGPNGPGAIYTLGTTGTTASLWIDLGTAVAGGNYRAGYTQNDQYFSDSGNTGWDAVGKTALGGLAINDANTEVYVINLADRRLYTIRVNPDGSAGAVSSIVIPTPANTTGITGANPLGDLRPFAVEFRNGLVYVGMVNSAESTQDRTQLRGYVYTYNPLTQTWSNRSVINESAAIDGFRFDYARASSFGGSDNFQAWRPTFGNLNPDFQIGVNNAVKYPQPILSGIAFDASGNLNLAIRDRAGDQLGFQIPSNPANPNELMLGISAGDLLKATNNDNGTWTLENNANADGTTTGGSNNAQGPGGGEFFFQDDYANGTHTDVQSGAVANVPGFPDVITTVFDPVRFGFTLTAGIRWYNDSNGTLTKAYEIYDNSTAGTFGKATGLGDLLVVIPPPGREIGNRVWNDTNANGRQDAGESGISGVQVILQLNGANFATAATDANGEYYFSSNPGTSTGSKLFGLNLTAVGTYSIAIPVVQGPLAGLSVTTTNLNANSEDLRDNDFALNILTNRAEFTVPALAAGQSDHTFDAGFRPPNTAQISGFVYNDRNDNGLYETGLGEPSIAGVTVVLTGTDSIGNAIVPVTTTTNGSGFYQFTGLVAGNYTVSETQPIAFLDGQDTPGSLGGNDTVNDVISAILLPAGGNSTDNNFGELEPAALNGFVYLDADDDGIFDAGETPIAGVTVVLTGSNSLGAITPQTLTTNASGFYSFTGLRPGSYTVSETQPVAFADGQDTPGVPGGGSDAVNDVISGITLTPNLVSPNNNFGERPLAASSLSGFVYYDLSNDGNRAGPPGEPGIPGATVVLTGVTSLGVTITPQTTTTDANGFYQFTGLQAGTYRVNETQPAGFLDGIDTFGSTGGTVTNDQIAAIPLADAQSSQNNNFGELLPAALNGFVYLDADNDGVFDIGETPIPGTTVVLTGTNDLGAIAPQTLTTSGTGFYSFTNLRPGTYTVTETQPAAFADGIDTPGTPGGGSVAVNDVISTITLTPGLTSPNNNFGERPLAASSISGFVYYDLSNDGLRAGPPGEPGIPGTTVVLTGVTALGIAIAPQTTTTDANGFYQFTGLQAGSYQVDETQPAGFLDGRDTAGSLGGTVTNDQIAAIVLPDSTASINNNFGELLPAALNGFVYIDADNDGVFDAAETPIPGTTVVLSGTDDLGAIAPQTLTTNGSGFYSFTGLRPGTYTVTETQPAGFVDGIDTPGTPGGGSAAVNDVISTITLTPGLTSPNNNFGERQLAQLSGFVYRDTDNDGIRELAQGETGITPVTVVLTGTVNGNPITPQTVTTDANGFYSFINLQPGTYTVTETQPAAFLDGRDTPGTPGGGSNAVNDVLSGIVLVPNDNSIENNFGELLPASLNGFVYVDADNDGVFDAGETPIGGTTVVLTGTNDLGIITPQTLTTTQAGFYSFTNLRPGTYRVSETQPTAFADGRDTPGTPGGGTSPVNDIIDTITLTQGLTSPNNNFGERLLPGSLSGYVYRDPDVNGIRSPQLGETGIAGTRVVLFFEGPNGLTAVQTAFTASDGFYQFNNLTPGNYRVVETQPLGFYDGIDTPGSTGGSNATNDALSSIPVPPGVASINNNFGEVQSVNLFGYVWIDTNRNAIFDAGEAPVPNAVVSISGTAFAGTRIANTLNAAQAPSGLSIITDANGRYDFFRLPPGSYSLVQTNTPAGLQDFASQNAAPGLPVQLSSLTTFDGIGLNTPAPGPLNFGKVFENPVSPPPGTDPSKESFLGSTLLGAVAPTGNPLIGPPTFAANTNPLFAVTNATSAESVYVSAGAGAGFAPVVRVFNYRTGVEISRFLAFDVGFLGGVQTATGDINGDGTPDIIAAAGPGAGPHVKVFDGLTGAEIRSFFAYDPTFRGGVLVASGDVDGDGFDDIITGAMSSAAPHVKVFSGRTGQEIQSFFAFDQSITTGVRVASADINGDGRADIVASTGEGTPARVRAFDGTTLALLSDLSVFDGYVGGVYVSAGDFDGDGRADIAVSSGVGASRVAVYNAGGGELASFFADTSNTSGVRVAMKDLNGDGIADVITGAGIGTASRITGFSGAGLGIIEDFYLFDSGVRTGVFVG